jgi:hypothetical protein
VTPTDKIALAALMMSGLAVAISTVAALYSRRQAIAAEASVPAPPPPVDWKIERDGHGFRMRNHGVSTATGVRILLPEENQIKLRVTDGLDVVPPGGSFGFSLGIRWASGWQLAEVPVVWDGQDAPVLVPLPLAASQLPR